MAKDYILKVCRNGLLMTGFYFFSWWATANTIEWIALKPFVVFLMLYVIGELINYYKIQPGVKGNLKTLIL